MTWVLKVVCQCRLNASLHVICKDGNQVEVQEKYVDVPTTLYQEKVVEVPKVQVAEVVKQVPKIDARFKR